MSNTNYGMTVDRICMYASEKEGMSYPSELANVRTVDRLIAEGYLRREIKTVDLPGNPNFPESCKAVAMMDTWSPRTIVLDTVYLVSWPPRS